jgi:hypothetical protein
MNVIIVQQPLLQRGGGVLQPAPLEHRHHNIDFLLSSSTVSVAGHAAPNATG